VFCSKKLQAADFAGFEVLATAKEAATKEAASH
jgi:hypothetical protein